MARVLLTHSLVTLYETLGGFALSIAVGTPLAVMLVYSSVLRSALYPLLVVTQAIPKVAIAPVLLLVIGAGEVSKVVIAFLVAFFEGRDRPLHRALSKLRFTIGIAANG